MTIAGRADARADEAADAARAHLHREPAGLRAGPAGRVLRSADDSRDRQDGRSARLPDVVVHPRRDQERRVPDEAGGAEATTDDAKVGWTKRRTGKKETRRELHHWKAHRPPDVPPRRGRDGGAAVPGRDGAGRQAARAGRGCRGGAHAAGLHRGGARPGRLQQLGREQVPLRAGDSRARLHARPGQPAERARGVPRLPDDRQQHRRADRRGVRAAGDRRRPLPLERGVPDAVAPEADQRLGPLGRDVARSALREALRPGHADAVDAVLHREPRPGRRLHLQLLLRLHRHDQLGVAERAAADDPRPARRLRHAVRIGRDRRRSRGAARDAQQHPRLDRRRSRARAPAARHRRPARGWIATSTTSARSSAASRRSKRTTAAARRASCPTRRPACPIRSPST